MRNTVSVRCTHAVSASVPFTLAKEYTQGGTHIVMERRTLIVELYELQNIYIYIYISILINVYVSRHGAAEFLCMLPAQTLRGSYHVKIRGR